MNKKEILWGCFEFGIPIICDGEMYKQLENKTFCRAVCHRKEFLGYKPTSKALAISKMSQHLTENNYKLLLEQYRIVEMFVKDGMNPFRFRHVHEGEFLFELEELAA